MAFLFYLLVFILGSVFASFALVLAERLPRGEKVLLSRSRCSFCRHKLSWLDLLPLVSWLALAGKCRYCGRKISGQYIWGEAILGVLFVAIAVKYNLLVGLFEAKPDYFVALQVVFAWLLATVLLAVFSADLRHFIIPNALLAGIVLLLIFFWGVACALNIYNSGFIITRVLSGFLFGGAFWGVWFFSKGEWLGLGDVKYFFVSGALLGAGGFLAMIFLASLAGSLVGVWQIVFRQKNLKSKLPFGVFLAPATLIVYSFLEHISNFLFNLLII